jgi:hypothetical protein
VEGGIRSAGTVLSGAPTVHGELGAAVQTSTAGAIDAMLRSGSIADSKSSRTVAWIGAEHHKEQARH